MKKKEEKQKESRNKNKFTKLDNYNKNLIINKENAIKYNKSKEKKINQKNNLDNNKSYKYRDITKNNDKNISNIKDEKINKNSEKEKIKNEIIYLLNILTAKNLLNVENQLTKLIITSSHIFNIEHNQDNARLFLSDIINNENIFIEILINKVISENNNIEIYSNLCSDLCNKYLQSINEILINKYIDTKGNNKKEYNIINNLKSQLKSECITKFDNLMNDFDNKNKQKQKILNLIDFICQLSDNNIIDLEACLSIINKLLNKYNENHKYRYHYLELMIYFLLKLEKIKDLKNNNTSIIIQKVNDIINKDIDINNTPKDCISRINNFKKIFTKKETEDNEIINQNKNNLKGIALLIKEDIDNYIKEKELYSKNNNGNAGGEEYNSSLLSSFKKIDLEEIINYYIDICINILSNHEHIIYYNNYIKNIIESIAYKLSLNKLRTFHNKMLQILSNLQNFCTQNQFMYEIMGYLIYLLIENELCDIEDINIFNNKDEESKITVSKTIKYTIKYDILSSGDDIHKYYEEFKNSDLFRNNNQLFDKYITFELKDLLGIKK
jgi:hypothetical protein